MEKPEFRCQQPGVNPKVLTRMTLQVTMIGPLLKRDRLWRKLAQNRLSIQGRLARKPRISLDRLRTPACRQASRESLSKQRKIPAKPMTQCGPSLGQCPLPSKKDQNRRQEIVLSPEKSSSHSGDRVISPPGDFQPNLI